MGNLCTNEVHKSLGGGKIKEGTLITSTKTSHKIKSTAKKISGSMMFVTEGFTTLAPQPKLKESYETVKETVEDLKLLEAAFYLASSEHHTLLLMDNLPFLCKKLPR